MELLKYCIPLAVVLFVYGAFRIIRKLSVNDELKDLDSHNPAKSPGTRKTSPGIQTVDAQLKSVDHISHKKQTVTAGELKLEDFIDLKQLQKIQDNFSEAMGMACITVNNEGEPVTRESGFTDFCIKHTRGSKEGLKRCYACDAGGGTLSAKTSRPAVYRCHSGLVDFGVPILIGDVQIGSLLGGQVLIESPDEEYFRKTAQEIGADENEYIEALRKVPVLSPEKVQSAANMLYLIANTLSDLSHNRWKATEFAGNLSEKSKTLVDSTIESTRSIVDQINLLRNFVVEQMTVVEEFSSTIEELSSTINSIARVSHAKNESSRQLLDMAHGGENSIKQTKRAIFGIVENAKQIGKFMHIISDINQQTNLLAINASIEAAHAGEKGGGFSVVANEIRKLAENSATNAVSVEKFLKDSTGQTEELTTMADDTESSYSMIKKEIQEVLNSLEEITSSTREVSQGSSEIVTGISDLQNISTSVSDSTIQIEEMINRINDSVNEMSGISEDVNEMVAVLNSSSS
ncbi:MAG: PocR ligand-binding domain-containing protein [Spirochaetales bacterium]|nr:PocR ligand-binding domain-containing protein [Spirochaetales bacterium]